MVLLLCRKLREEGIPAKGIPECPEWLLPEAKKERERLADLMNQTYRSRIVAGNANFKEKLLIENKLTFVTDSSWNKIELTTNQSVAVKKSGQKNYHVGGRDFSK